MLGGKGGFLSFHEEYNDVPVLDIEEMPIQMTDEDALALANELLGEMLCRR